MLHDQEIVVLTKNIALNNYSDWQEVLLGECAKEVETLEELELVLHNSVYPKIGCIVLD